MMPAATRCVCVIFCFAFVYAPLITLIVGVASYTHCLSITHLRLRQCHIEGLLRATLYTLAGNQIDLPVQEQYDQQRHIERAAGGKDLQEERERERGKDRET